MERETTLEEGKGFARPETSRRQNIRTLVKEEELGGHLTPEREESLQGDHLYAMMKHFPPDGTDLK